LTIAFGRHQQHGRVMTGSIAAEKGNQKLGAVAVAGAGSAGN
jgi:hypothetical protein